MPSLNELFKKFWRRLPLWLTLVTVLILADEYLKEGYLINPRDLLVIGTHENILLIFYIATAVLALLKRLREKKSKSLYRKHV